MKAWKTEALASLFGLVVVFLVWLAGISLVVFVIVKLLQIMGVL